MYFVTFRKKGVMPFVKKLLFVIGFLFFGFISFGSELDLSQDPEFLSKEVRLTGTWDFYWQEFVDPVTMNSMRDPIDAKVPSYWNTYECNGEKIPSRGFATYALRVIIPHDAIDQRLAVYFPFIDVAIVCISMEKNYMNVAILLVPRRRKFRCTLQMYSLLRPIAIL